jgi:branched-chain amino acid transport system permease protein
MADHIVFMLQLIITGVAVGGVYSLMALGFVLIFKASSVVNFGPGELVLFGAYVAWATILPMNLPLYVALPLTLGVAVLLGLVIERARCARSSASRSSGGSWSPSVSRA